MDQIFPDMGEYRLRLNTILDRFTDKELQVAIRVLLLKNSGKMGAKDLKSLNRILQKHGGRIDINAKLMNDNELLLTEEFVFLG